MIVVICEIRLKNTKIEILHIYLQLAIYIWSVWKLSFKWVATILGMYLKDDLTFDMHACF